MFLPGFVIQYECHLRNPLYVLVFEELKGEYLDQLHEKGLRRFSVFLFICDRIAWFEMIDLLHNSDSLNVWNLLHSRSENIAGVDIVNVRHEEEHGLEDAVYGSVISRYPNFSMESREIPMRTVHMNSSHRFVGDLGKLVNSRRMS